MAYVKTDWENLPSTDTPITETALDNMENGIEYNDQRLNGTKPMGSIVVDDVSCKNMLPNYAISGGYSDTGYVASTNYITIQYIPVKPNTQYTLSSLNLSLTKYTAIRVVSFDINRTFIRRNSAITLENITSFTTDNDAYYIALCFYTGQTASVSDLTQGQLEIGDTATTYTPYKAFDNQEVYSLGEMKIGTWIDGKDIYRKVIDIGLVPNNTTTTIDVSNLNIDYLVNLRGMLKSQNAVSFRPLPFPAGGANDIRIDVNNGSLRIQTFATWSGFTPNYVILEYTKATSGTRSIETAEEENR